MGSIPNPEGPKKEERKRILRRIEGTRTKTGPASDRELKSVSGDLGASYILGQDINCSLTEQWYQINYYS